MNATQLTEQRINISLLSPCGHSRSRAHVILDVLGKQQYEAFCILDLSCLIPIELTHMYTTHRAGGPVLLFCFIFFRQGEIIYHSVFLVAQSSLTQL